MQECPICESKKVKIEKSPEFEEQQYVGYSFINVIIACSDCGWSGNCIFTKKDEVKLMNRLLPLGSIFKK